MKKILILTLATLFITGCGGGSSSGSSSSGPSGSVEMEINTAETVYPGNKIVKNSEDTLIQVSHTDGVETSTVVLLQGSATIIRNP